MLLYTLAHTLKGLALILQKLDRYVRSEKYIHTEAGREEAKLKRADVIIDGATPNFPYTMEVVVMMEKDNMTEIEFCFPSNSRVHCVPAKMGAAASCCI